MKPGSKKTSTLLLTSSLALGLLRKAELSHQNAFTCNSSFIYFLSVHPNSLESQIMSISTYLFFPLHPLWTVETQLSASFYPWVPIDTLANLSSEKEMQNHENNVLGERKSCVYREGCCLRFLMRDCKMDVG
uniref:Uncharacterized protein n=1 Tax=Schistocephalus solidus TaxID=70667 RepID=A0A0V0J305_SCHSO